MEDFLDNDDYMDYGDYDFMQDDDYKDYDTQLFTPKNMKGTTSVFMQPGMSKYAETLEKEALRDRLQIALDQGVNAITIKPVDSPGDKSLYAVDYNFKEDPGEKYDKLSHFLGGLGKAVMGGGGGENTWQAQVGGFMTDYQRSRLAANALNKQRAQRLSTLNQTQGQPESKSTSPIKSKLSFLDDLSFEDVLGW